MPEARLLTAVFERIIGCLYITHCMFWRQGGRGRRPWICICITTLRRKRDRSYRCAHFSIIRNNKYAWGQTTYSCFWENYWLSVYNPLYVLTTGGRGRRPWICICISTLWQKRDRSYRCAHFSIIRNKMSEARLLTAVFERIIGCLYITHCMFWRQGAWSQTLNMHMHHHSQAEKRKSYRCANFSITRNKNAWGQTTYSCFWENYWLSVYNPLYVLTTGGRGRRPWICICITTPRQKRDRSYIYAHFSIIRNKMSEARLLTAVFERVIGCLYITHCMFCRQGGVVADPEYVYASLLSGRNEIGRIDVNNVPSVKGKHI